MTLSLNSAFGWFKYFASFLIVGVISVYFTFSPLILTPFHHHDSYKNALGDSSRPCRADDAVKFNLQLTRPILAQTECYNFRYANTLSGLSTARFVDVLLIGLCFACFAMWLNRSGFTFWSAAFISGSLFVLPCLQTTLIAAAHALPLAILFAFFAMLSTHTAVRYKKWHALIFYSISVIFLMLSFLSYPALSAFYLVPIFIYVLFRRLDSWVDLRKTIVIDVCLFSMCSFLYFIIAKYHAINIGFVSGSMHRYDGLNLNIFNRILTLLYFFPRQANIYANSLQSILIYTVLGGGTLISLYQFLKSKFFKQNRSQATSYLLQKMIVLVGLFILGSIVFLISPVMFSATRVIHIFYVMSVLLVIWGLFNWTKAIDINNKYLFTVLVAALFFINAAIANYYTAKSALNDNFEMNYIATSIANYLYDHDHLNRIHVVTPLAQSFNGLGAVEDIFNLNSSIMDQDIYYMLASTLKKLDMASGKNCIFINLKENYTEKEKQCIANEPERIAFTLSHPGEPVYQSNNMLVIDMNTPSNKVSL